MMYAFAVELHMPFEKALDEVNQAITEEGLGVVTAENFKPTRGIRLQGDLGLYGTRGPSPPPWRKRDTSARRRSRRHSSSPAMRRLARVASASAGGIAVV